MSFRLLSLDGKILAELHPLLQQVKVSYNFDPILELSIRFLEGNSETNSILSSIQDDSSLSPDVIRGLIKSSSVFLWDCSKNIITTSPSGSSNFTATVKILEGLLVKNGLNEQFVDQFGKFLIKNRERLRILKRSMSFSSPHYDDLVWRLEVELSRRNLLVTTDSLYQLRLDVKSFNKKSTNEQFIHPNYPHDSLPSYSHTSSSAIDGEITNSYHLQADFANMKNLYVELQKGLDELNGIHGQRLTRYIA